MNERPHLLHVFSTFALGGPQMRFAALVASFGGVYRHCVLAMDGDYAAAQLLSSSPDVTLLDEVRPEKKRLISNILAFRKRLAGEKPDLLLTYNWGAIEWALANTPMTVPHIHVEDGFGPEEAGRRIRRRAFLRRLALAGKRVVVASETLREIARREWGVSEARLTFIPNGADAPRFRNAVPLSGAFGAVADGPLIGAVAGLRPEKNLSRLVGAFALIAATRPVRLAIVGDGPEAGKLKAQAEALGLADRVYFTGALADPAPAFAAFDLFMLSSDTEQAPIALIEAMAAGLPVTATDVGDISRMLAPVNRSFVTPLDERALAKAVLALLDDEALRRRIGDENRRRAEENYSRTSMTEAWRNLIKDSINLDESAKSSSLPATDCT